MLTILVLRMMAAYTERSEDSEEFRDALVTWSAVLCGPGATPRSMKAFRNWTRYLVVAADGGKNGSDVKTKYLIGTAAMYVRNSAFVTDIATFEDLTREGGSLAGGDYEVVRNAFTNGAEYGPDWDSARLTFLEIAASAPWSEKPPERAAQA